MKVISHTNRNLKFLGFIIIAFGLPFLVFAYLIQEALIAIGFLVPLVIGLLIIYIVVPVYSIFYDEENNVLIVKNSAGQISVQFDEIINIVERTHFSPKNGTPWTTYSLILNYKSKFGKDIGFVISDSDKECMQNYNLLHQKIQKSRVELFRKMKR